MSATYTSHGLWSGASPGCDVLPAYAAAAASQLLTTTAQLLAVQIGSLRSCHSRVVVQIPLAGPKSNVAIRAPMQADGLIDQHS